MNERDAIAFEMQELKEQGRLDWEMYFELRKQRSKRYAELQDRLREIDERDLRGHQIVPVMLDPDSVGLPKPKNEGMSVTDLKLDRVVRKRNTYKNKSKALISDEQLCKAIEDHLKEVGTELTARQLKKVMEDKLGVVWSNFNNALNRIIWKDNHIQVNKDNKYFLYYYDENSSDS